MERRLLLAVVTLSALTITSGCIAPVAQLPSSQSSADAPRSRTGSDARRIYVANNDEILIFPERPHDPAPIGTIVNGVNGAYGLCVDAAGNLYVANRGNSTLSVYSPGSSTPSKTYSAGLDAPMYPAVDAKGDIFASSGNGTVVEYIRGQPYSFVTLKTPGYETDGIALDSSGKLYVAYRTTLYSGSIEEFTPGSTQGQILGMSIIQPQGMIVTSDGTILLVQTGPADGVYVFPRGSTNPSLKLSMNFFETPAQIALTGPEHKLFVSAFGWLGSGRVYVTGYPLSVKSTLHEKIAFRLRHHDHRRKHRFGIQGIALSND